MNSVQTWGEAITGSVVDLWYRFINFLPGLIGALIVFLMGLIVAIALGKVAKKLIEVLKIDQVVDKMNLEERLRVKIKISVFFGELVKWFLILVFLMAATNILGLVEVSEFLNKIILYIPNIVVAVIILSIAFLVGNFVYGVVRSSTRVAGIMSASLMASISKWAIVIFGLLAALIQLGIAVSLVNTIFIAVMAALALAFGLAFGLGGRDEAALILKKVRENLEK